MKLFFKSCFSLHSKLNRTEQNILFDTLEITSYLAEFSNDSYFIIGALSHVSPWVVFVKSPKSLLWVVLDFPTPALLCNSH